MFVQTNILQATPYEKAKCEIKPNKEENFIKFIS